MSASNSTPTSGKAIAPSGAKPGYNAADEKSVGARKQSEKIREQRRVEGLRKVMADADSRLWLRGMLEACGVYRTSFTGNSTTFFNEGQRNIGLMLHADLVRHCPEAMVAMLRETDAAEPAVAQTTESETE